MCAATRWPTRRPPLGDVVIGVALGVGVLIDGASGGILAAPDGSLDADGAVLIALVAAVLCMRRRAPIPVLLATNAVVAAWFLLDNPGRLITVAALIGCYTVAAECGWRWGAAGWAITAVNSILVIHATLRDGWFDDPTVNALSLSVASVALGMSVHYHRAFAASVAERTERIAASRAESARRRAAEQRLDVARELHDVFGHTMATISVQAGVAGHLTGRDPEQAARALTTIKTISDEGLAEVQVLLGLLRTDGVPAGGGLARLDHLLDVTRRTGTHVELAVRGRAGLLPPATDLAAFRIVQESLTNARRHSPGSAIQVRVLHGAEMVEVVVRNEPATAAAPAGPSGGHGIDGMRNRAEALGGTLTAGARRTGEFEVRCTLPVEWPTDPPVGSPGVAATELSVGSPSAAATGSPADTKGDSR